MPSFASLKSSRKSREAKSYVKSSIIPEPPSTTVPLQPSSNEGSVSERDIAIFGPTLPQDVEIRLSQDSGRGLYAKVPFKPGRILISSRPSISVLSNSYLVSHCSNCFGPVPEGDLKRCTLCKAVYYCDAACQTKDWPLHKFECAALQNWSKTAPSQELSVPSDAVRCLGRILWLRQKQAPDGAWAKQLAALVSHRSSMHPSSFELHTHLSHALVRYLGVNSPQELADFGISTAGDLVELTSRFVSNAIAVAMPSLTPIGVALSPVVALLNHSCDPNAVIVFPRASKIPKEQEPSVQIVVLREITPEEEITISYIDTTLPKSLRQKALRETYNFTCACSLCSSQQDVDPRAALNCPKSCGGMCPIPTQEDTLSRCAKCKAVVTSPDAILDAVRLGQEGLDKATSLQTKDSQKARRLTTKLVPILTSAGLMPSSHPLLGLSRLHQSLMISFMPSPLTQDYLDDIIRVQTQSVTGLTAVLPFGHPARAIALAELGKMLAVDEPQPRQPKNAAEASLTYPPSGPPRLNMAYDTLVRARGEMLVGFGGKNEGGTVGREVRESIVMLEKEISVWKEGIRNAFEDTVNQSKRNNGQKDDGN